MDGRPLGTLTRKNPLLAYLRCHILPQLGFTVSHPSYEVFRFSDSRDLYLYVEKQGGPRLVGKFFQGPDPIQARKRGETECNDLLFLRESGLSGWPHRVTRPFGFNPEINNLLVVEYVAAEPLSDILEAAIQRGRCGRRGISLSDAQSAWGMPAMRALGIDTYFDPIVISGDYNFRKPDRRLFEKTLAGMQLEPQEVVMVGNDIYHDVFGAKQLGIRTVFFSPTKARSR